MTLPERLTRLSTPRERNHFGGRDARRGINGQKLKSHVVNGGTSLVRGPVGCALLDSGVCGRVPEGRDYALLVAQWTGRARVMLVSK